jgi:hypothetical protein
MATPIEQKRCHPKFCRVNSLSELKRKTLIGLFSNFNPEKKIIQVGYKKEVGLATPLLFFVL